MDDELAQQRRENVTRQLVVVVAGADQVPALAMQDLTAALAQVRRLPLM